MKSLFSLSINNGADQSCSAKSHIRPSDGRVLRRSVLAASFCLLTLAAATSHAADVPEAAIAFRPGDTVRVFVTFKEPITLKGALVRFYLQGQLPEGQKVFVNFFDVSSPVKSSEREFELTGKIGDHVATGTYQIAFMNASDGADLSRTFNSGQDFPAVTLCIRNDKHVEFPDVKSIKLGEPYRDMP